MLDNKNQSDGNTSTREKKYHYTIQRLFALGEDAIQRQNALDARRKQLENNPPANPTSTRPRKGSI